MNHEKHIEVLTKYSTILHKIKGMKTDADNRVKLLNKLGEFDKCQESEILPSLENALNQGSVSSIERKYLERLQKLGKKHGHITKAVLSGFKKGAKEILKKEMDEYTPYLSWIKSATVDQLSEEDLASSQELHGIAQQIVNTIQGFEKSIEYFCGEDISLSDLSEAKNSLSPSATR